jgi:hypothetical protein
VVVELELAGVGLECLCLGRFAAFDTDLERWAGLVPEQPVEFDTEPKRMFVDVYSAAHQRLPEAEIATVAVAWASDLALAEQAAAADLVSVERLPDAVVSKLASVFASHDFDELLLAPVRIQGIAHPYNDGNDSIHTVNSHNAVPNIFDLYIPRCVSIIASYQRSEASLNIAHLRDGISLHVSREEDVAVDDATPAVDRTLGELFRWGAEEETGPGLGPHSVADSAEEAGTGFARAVRAPVAVVVVVQVVPCWG